MMSLYSSKTLTKTGIKDQPKDQEPKEPITKGVQFCRHQKIWEKESKDQRLVIYGMEKGMPVRLTL